MYSGRQENAHLRIQDADAPTTTRDAPAVVSGRQRDELHAEPGGRIARHLHVRYLVGVATARYDERCRPQFRIRILLSGLQSVAGHELPAGTYGVRLESEAQ